jgi:hypothetical protein
MVGIIHRKLVTKRATTVTKSDKQRRQEKQSMEGGRRSPIAAAERAHGHPFEGLAPTMDGIARKTG